MTGRVEAPTEEFPVNHNARIECDLMVSGGLVLTLDDEGRILQDGAVAIKGTKIAAVGCASDLTNRYHPRLTICGQNKIVMPGFVNVHNHSPLMITRGMVEDLGFAPMYTPGIPQGHMLSEEETYALACLGVYEMLRAGSTTIMDFYRYPQALAQAHADVGTRAVIAGRVHDADPEALAQGRHEYSKGVGAASLRENAELISAWNGHDGGRIRCDWAPHAPDTCSDDLLRQVARLADDHGGRIHTHLAQSRAEVRVVRERSGMSPAQTLQEAGLLDHRTNAAHCIHLDDEDIRRCGRAGITVAHSPIGNAKSGDVAPILELREAGAAIALCTDTMSGDMIEAMRWAVSMQRVRQGGRILLDARVAVDWGDTRSGGCVRPAG